jgi:hypothetical protein
MSTQEKKPKGNRPSQAPGAGAAFSRASTPEPKPEKPIKNSDYFRARFEQRSYVRNFFSGHFRLWGLRVGVVIILSTAAAIRLGALTQRQEMMIAAIPLFVLLLLLPWWPVYLEEGPYYVVISPGFNVQRAVSGGWHAMSPFHSVVEHWSTTTQQTLSFSEIEKIPTLERAQVRLRGDGRFKYNPALLNFSGLSREQRKDRWHNEIRMEMEDIAVRLRIALRQIIKTHLAQHKGGSFWMHGLFHLNVIIEEKLRARAHELGVTVYELTVDVDIPLVAVAAWEKDQAEMVNAITKTREMTAFFAESGIPMTQDSVYRYMLFHKSPNIRLRLTDDINNLVGTIQPLAGSGPLTATTSRTDLMPQLVPPALSEGQMIPPPHPPLYQRALRGLAWLLLKLASLSVYGLQRVARRRPPTITVSVPEAAALPNSTPSNQQLPSGEIHEDQLPSPARARQAQLLPRLPRNASPWLPDAGEPPQYIESNPTRPVGKEKDFYGYLDEDDLENGSLPVSK